ncbi:polymorphic toxin-type HINT domain-containing protein [Kutzneria sp. CA-103260]|uniref:polymorphic toxin-type HINT domain-containing protein n=1 Tax=Kutzneria sp. CA-103260 TaxID=2802641 RepID=UPI002010FA1D|nr:polymorphic toxin-type HINT domain-containing protein [Kutzneria sp. CA-103260]
MTTRAVGAALALAVLAGVVQAAPATAATAAPVRPAATSDESPARPMPPELYHEWDGKDGLPPLTSDPRLRQIVVDNAELDPDQEVRDAAKAALDANTNDAIMAYLNGGQDTARAKADARRAEAARQDRAAIEPLRGTGGPYLRAEVDRVLAGTDADRAQFVAYGRAIAEQRDAQATQDEKTRLDQNRARVQALVAAGGPAVSKAAQAALAGGDAAVAEFLKTGYLTAAKADADAREQELKDQEERDKAADALSDLAKKAARASAARQQLMVAHGNGVRALEQASNALVLAGAEARKAAQILAANTAGGQHPADSFDVVKAEVARQLGYARTAAGQAAQAATAAKAQADVLVDTGLTYGTQWAQMAQGMADAAQAAVSASETAQHAIDATAYTDQARNAQEQAERHAAEAAAWRQHAEEHARAAASIAAAAQAQADAAKDAAARTKQARQVAEAARDRALAAAQRTRDARITAENEAAKAAAARQVAQQEQANAASARARAEQQAAVAKSARGEADRYAGIAAAARKDAETQDGIAGQAETNATNEEHNAAAARDRAFAAERNQQASEARAQALEAAAAAARGTANEQPARDAANQARSDATTAMSAAVGARGAANTATGAAVGARSAATDATRAAARARAAAQQAAAAAARANAAANKAEAEAAATHAAALQANAAAADATANEAQAAEAARAAVRLAEQAAAEAVESLRSAERTRAEADAAATEAVSAATQANLAVQASTAARASSQAITDPANTAITVAAPFAGSDVDADFVILVANQAKSVGAEQAKAAQDRANEALDAANKAADAAAKAAAEVKPAFDAAAAAAKSSADAARSAAQAQQAAADAAVDGAAARAAAAKANDADAQAHADAVRARQAANNASNDAAIAGRSASAAESDAAAARSTAAAAEADAAAARGAADQAEADATKANAAADSAQKHADAVAEAAKNARDSAVQAQQAADRAEEAARKAEEANRRDQVNQGDAKQADLTPDEEQLLLQAGGPDLLKQYKDGLAEANKGILDFIKENGADVLLELIGVKDAERCFGEGDIIGCLWTVVNVGSLLIAIGKIPAVSKAIGRVAEGLAKFLDGTSAGRKLLERLNKFPVCNCFPAGTPVATEHGSKPIEQIAVGDRVWVRALDTGQSRLRAVSSLFSKHADTLLTITAGTAVVEVTPQHPFWVVDRGWVDAGDLRVGEHLQSRDGSQPAIASITTKSTSTTVYNFEVEGDHNYYVTEGQLLVHNCARIWEAIKGTQDVYEGTALPKSFELSLEGADKVWVAPNATKHMLERMPSDVRPALRDLAAQVQLSSLRSAVQKAVKAGYKYDEMVVVDGWELIFGPPKTGPLPTLYHALQKN